MHELLQHELGEAEEEDQWDKADSDMEEDNEDFYGDREIDNMFKDQDGRDVKRKREEIVTVFNHTVTYMQVIAEPMKSLHLSFTHMRLDEHKMKVQLNPHCIP